MREKFRIVGGESGGPTSPVEDKRTDQEKIRDMFDLVLKDNPRAVTVIVDKGPSIYFRSFPDLDSVDIGNIKIAHELIESALHSFGPLEDS